MVGGENPSGDLSILNLVARSHSMNWPPHCKSSPSITINRKKCTKLHRKLFSLNSGLVKDQSYPIGVQC